MSLNWQDKDNGLQKWRQADGSYKGKSASYFLHVDRHSQGI